MMNILLLCPEEQESLFIKERLAYYDYCHTTTVKLTDDIIEIGLTKKPILLIIDIDAIDSNQFFKLKRIKHLLSIPYVLLIYRKSIDIEYLVMLRKWVNGFALKSTLAENPKLVIEKLRGATFYFEPTFSVMVTKEINALKEDIIPDLKNNERIFNSDTKLNERTKHLITSLHYGIPRVLIAKKLGISNTSVDQNIQRLKEKYDFTNTREMVSYFIDKGFQ